MDCWGIRRLLGKRVGIAGGGCLVLGEVLWNLQIDAEWNTSIPALHINWIITPAMIWLAKEIIYDHLWKDRDVETDE